MSVTRSQLEAWSTEYLAAAAERMQKRAAEWTDTFHSYHATVDKPGGTIWSGRIAGAVYDRAVFERTLAVRAAATLEDLAKIARNAAAEQDEILARIKDVIEDAERLGYVVDDDLSIRPARSRS